MEEILHHLRFLLTLEMVRLTTNLNWNLGIFHQHSSTDINSIWVVVLNMFYFHPYLEKWSNLTNIFQMGWNHQLGMFFFFDPLPVLCSVLVCSVGYSDKIHVSQGMHNRHSPNQECCRMRKLAETANVVISSTKNTSSWIITDQQDIPDEYGTWKPTFFWNLGGYDCTTNLCPETWQIYVFQPKILDI